MEKKSEAQPDAGTSISIPVSPPILQAALNQFGSQQWQVQLASMANQAWQNWYNRLHQDSPDGSNP
jgi:hypothetical protein